MLKLKNRPRWGDGILAGTFPGVGTELPKPMGLTSRPEAEAGGTAVEGQELTVAYPATVQGHAACGPR